MSSLTLDAVDWRILDVLQQDARIANVDLARRVHLSASPCLARVRKLVADPEAITFVRGDVRDEGALAGALWEDAGSA